MSFITFQQDHHIKCRAPFLAQMELQSRLIARRDPKADEHEMVTHMVNYYKKFGSKLCAAMDLKLFLSSLEKQELKDFFDKTFIEIDLDDKLVPKTVDQIHRHVNWYQLQRFSGNTYIVESLVVNWGREIYDVE